MSEVKPMDQLLLELKERAKELNCLYRVQELLINPENSLHDICRGLVEVIPPGWQYPDICCAKVILSGEVFTSQNFSESKWMQKAAVLIQEEAIGEIRVYYTEEMPELDEGPFLKEERKLINSIAERLGLHMLHNKLKSVFEEQLQEGREPKSSWLVIVDMLRQTNPKLLISLSRKMVNYLCWTGIKEAEPLLEQFSPVLNKGEELDENRPYKKRSDSDLVSLSYQIFETAENYLSEEKILDSIQKWTKEDRSGFLSRVLENMGSSLIDINSAIERYHHLGPHMLELSEPRIKSLRVALIRRLLTDQSAYIDIAKRFARVDSFKELLDKVIHPLGSHGKLGGKSAGLLLAKEIIDQYAEEYPSFKEIKTPKTWYITSDGLLSFMDYNNLEDVLEQKYKDIAQVRQEYPYVIQVFKSSSFPPEIVKGLLLAIEDFGEVPLVVRSSSLLEDRIGTAFAGKYKSLFIANQGNKKQRLIELMDAVAEVYASTFGPDPIDYRAENDLLDYHEEMGIMIQEVVGTKVGPYYFPSFAGVAFSRNEFRWSPRIRREDGLVRIVPGLGTRAVDRLSNDYPILISPGQPNLKVNVTIDEFIRYSPVYIDVINLQSGEFETVELEKLKAFGSEYPMIHQVVSRLEHNHLQQVQPMGLDFGKDHLVVTFNGLVSRTGFVKQVADMLEVLQKEYNQPIDIEFAHDGRNLHLLQCRSQSSGVETKPANIPQDVPPEKTIFTAKRFISNGTVSDITHVVYVDPKKYGEVGDIEKLKLIGATVGRLNKMLPKKQFILMGPGRWGSRGDIKLGVSVTYSDINNTSMLIEIARRTKDYVPELSFGTHFFQDLVESNIRYLPLYPDEGDSLFNEDFLMSSENLLLTFLPDMVGFEEIIRVIDVPASTDGMVMQVLMNGDTNRAVAMLSPLSELDGEMDETVLGTRVTTRQKDVHWQWRLRNVEKLAAQLDPARFGVKGLYLFGSVKNAHAGPASDIDVLVHFGGTDTQRSDLLSWLEGWSLALSQINFLRTGFKTSGLLDVHLITDEDIAKRDCFALKIGAVSDPARPLTMGTAIIR
jgi:hypothetical protein